MRTVAVAVLLSLAVPTVWAQRPVVSPSGYGRQLFPGGGPPGTGGTGFGRAINPGGVIGSGIGPGFPANPGVPAVGRLRPSLPAYSFPIVVPGQVWPTPGYPGFASYPYANGGYYGYDPPQAQFINNYSPSANYGPTGDGQVDQQQPVVIVNQYFRPDQAPAVPQATTTAPQSTTVAPAPAATTPTNTATGSRPDQPYFLIAMKDTTIYAASSYWVEGNTLNYITLQGNENQVSMDLVDRDLSRRLNRDRSVAFGLPSH